MAEVTVADFAKVLKVPVDRLLVQLDEAGIKVGGADAVISEDAKLELLTHLRKTHGRKDAGESAPRRITLNRKSSSEIKLGSSQGRARTVNVEVRQKRTYIKRDVLEEQARKQQEELDAVRRADEEARTAVEREAQAKRDAEERERKAAEAREAEERRRAEEEKRRAQQADEEAQKRADEERKRAAVVGEGSAAACGRREGTPEAQEGADGRGARRSGPRPYPARRRRHDGATPQEEGAPPLGRSQRRSAARVRAPDGAGRARSRDRPDDHSGRSRGARWPSREARSSSRS